MIRCIAALDEKQGIANDHGIPWQGKIPGDVAYYHDKVKDNPVIMGFGLYKELTKPYPGGSNYVATTDPNVKLRDGFKPVTDAVAFLNDYKGDIWDMGGALLFASTIDLVEELYITQLEGDFKCTKFFPEYKDSFERVSRSPAYQENGVTYYFEVWKRI